MADKIDKINSLVKTTYLTFENDTPKFIKMLSVMAVFPYQSIYNQTLIYIQKPDATNIMGKAAWGSRQCTVNENAVPIQLLLPYLEQIESYSDKSFRQENGKYVIENEKMVVDRDNLPKFKLNYHLSNLYDISQTTSDISGPIQKKAVYSFMKNIKQYGEVYDESIYNLSFEIKDDIDDTYKTDPIEELIYLKPNLSENEENIAVAKGFTEYYCISGVKSNKWTNFEIEAIKYIVLNYLNKNEIIDDKNETVMSTMVSYKKVYDTKSDDDNFDKDFISNIEYIGECVRNILNALIGKNLSWEETAIINDIFYMSGGTIKDYNDTTIDYIAMLRNAIENDKGNLLFDTDIILKNYSKCNKNGYTQCCDDIENKKLFSSPPYKL